MMITVKVLGAGCPNCWKVEAIVREAATLLGIGTEILKVTDPEEMMQYRILATPGLVINEKLVCTGRIPDRAEVISWLASASESVQLA